MQFSTEIPQSGTPQIHMFSGRICAERGPRSQREQSRPTGLITDGAGRGETAINADLQPAVAALKPVLMPGMGIEVMEVGIGHAFGGNAADHIDHANYLTASIHLEFGEVVGILVPHHDTESCAQWGDGSFGPDVNHLGCGRFARHSDEYTGFVGNKRVTVHIGFGVGRAGNNRPSGVQAIRKIIMHSAIQRCALSGGGRSWGVEPSFGVVQRVDAHYALFGAHIQLVIGVTAVVDNPVINGIGRFDYGVVARAFNL